MSRPWRVLGNLWSLVPWSYHAGRPHKYSAVQCLGRTLREKLTKLQAAKDPQDQPHDVVERQDCVDGVIASDPAERRCVAHVK